MFTTYYSFERFKYLHSLLENDALFECNNKVIIPKTACFFSADLDVYIDTSDGVNDDLQVQEYCGRIMACINMSKGRKFLFFKSAYSPKWSQNIEQLAHENNGIVIPFFKWSFNRDFYKHVYFNLNDLRNRVLTTQKTIDVGLFADFNKTYRYPKPSSNDHRISWGDIEKFNLRELGTDATMFKDHYNISSRENILNTLERSELTTYHGTLPYEKYIQKSLECAAVINPPGIGEYTSRMFDQTSIGNLIVLRKNSYDNGISWKDYIPEVDFSCDTWKEDLAAVVDSKVEWQQKGMYYFDNCWSSHAIVAYFKDKILEHA